MGEAIRITAIRPDQTIDRAVKVSYQPQHQMSEKGQGRTSREKLEGKEGKITKRLPRSRRVAHIAPLRVTTRSIATTTNGDQGARTTDKEMISSGGSATATPTHAAAARVKRQRSSGATCSRNP
ncbi:hypothetical protein X777_05543 [Ooceraea biroi]|uniref:Uncharacterized protein n=1 Tax=Ooceraea biroi TaxID=2015173 RepID=A0A026WEE9_OOCBI|nr:hypothetical protein X777_05543 [Ooceraea biroi]